MRKKRLLRPALPLVLLALAIAAARAATFTVVAGPDWAPYAHSVEIAPGGVFDYSALLDAPAGKHGALRATPAGHFEFENRPGERVRFWGPNLTFTANYFSKTEADRLAERFARSGYNTVRLHHFDRDLVRKGGDSWELDPRKLDQLDYLFAAMKKRGIYINIDLFSSRTFSDAELASFGFPRGGKSRLTADNYKGLVPVSKAAYESWALYAKNLLTHKNPHTGLTWAGDPALIGICPVNEDQLFNRISNPGVLALYKKAFVESGAGTEKEAGLRSSAAWNRFIIETQAASNARIFAFLRSLGVKALLTGSNSETTQSESFLREHYDYVDNHAYWDHPKFPGRPWQPPFEFHQKKSTADAASVPRKLFATRVFGRPFTVTEFNFCRPNQYRHEGAVLMPAYAGLQDWDALYNFQYAMSRESALDGGVDNYFAIANDPVGLVADRVGALLFLRADIAPARGALVWAARPGEAFSDQWLRYPAAFTKLGLVTRIGSLTGQPADVLTRAGAGDLKPHAIAAAVIGAGDSTWKTKRFENPDPLPPKTYLADDTLPALLQRDGALPAGSVNADATRFTSDTGEIELRADEGSVRVVTPRSALFVVPAGARLSGGLVSIEENTADVAIGVVSLDGLPLAGARRILVTHLTDALPAGAVFAESDRRLISNWGQGPHLVRRGETLLTLRLAEAGDGNWRAWAVDATGARAREIPLAKTEGDGTAALAIRLATTTPEGTQLAYELAR
ncbi:glycosyl hydrolase family 5 [Termitidicoccus mucosus]|uniref:Glycosyl hydrolase family 5 n=1 Tax=Termitidicoccus mucosus TaxID=1184151 RepID=A0A178IBC1_9BACT|nr:glycosyl hydrolase family 5 [Opitutaceae bacterium TSB47]